MPLNPIPPDPEPTEADLAPHWVDHPGVERRILLHLASMRWRAAKRLEDPNAFLVMSFGDYKYYAAYRRRKLWKEIKSRVL